ncbi:hypothetical protein HPB52_017999 [Rhipicephalus sanguineus]|uniref:THO complex subunit 2 N-terminal domain-containing protein n=1 Tax=Rhipicephalus sanguineus TaxID=34632 RepID=A0A9D4T456_RHISA|nr:hypothetical protein HPB52_017999 [Rhipicephalus sanguineus]
MQTSRLPADRGGKDLQLLLHDLCWHVVEDRLKVDQALAALAEVTVSGVVMWWAAFEPCGFAPRLLCAGALCLLRRCTPRSPPCWWTWSSYWALSVRACLDTLLTTSLDLETLSTENRDQRDRFHWLLAGCAKVVPDALLKERIEIESLGDAGIVRNSRTTATKFVKIKTRLFYKQNKYNLFREESEGYAKLATELSQEITTKISPDYMIEVMRSLIGCFNLDPNRVLDVVLEAFECRIHLENFFVPLLTKFLCNPATISQGDAGEPTPLSLYRLAAVLIRNEVIALDDLYTLEENQKLGLCEALLEVGDWLNAQRLMQRLPEHYAVSQPHIARRLCLLVHTLVEPLYSKHSGLPEGFRRPYNPPSGGLRPLPLVETFGEFRTLVLPMLMALGPLMHIDPVLIVKIVRLGRAFLHQKGSAAADLRFDLLTLLGETLLPSLSLLECNCCVADEIWSLVKLFPYQQSRSAAPSACADIDHRFHQLRAVVDTFVTVVIHQPCHRAHIFSLSQLFGCHRVSIGTDTDDGFLGRWRYVESVLAVIVSAEEAAQQVCRIQRLRGHRNIGFANSGLSSTHSSLSSFTTPVTARTISASVSSSVVTASASALTGAEGVAVGNNSGVKESVP